ncbi:MAG TPA: hypothetical protein PKD53_26200 [Chloroflexaceae bacterium]|nr:hypothetical protein [Chloroflexaceae bacterium]
MGKLLLALGGLAALLLLASAIIGAGQDRYDPVQTARQYAESARYYAEAEAIAQAAQHEAYWSPIRAAVANGATIAVILALAAVVIVAAIYVGAQAVAHARFRFRHALPDERGLLPVRLADLGDVAPRALGAYHGARQIEAARQPVPHTITYSPRQDYRADGAGGLGLPAEPPALALPGLTDLASLGWTPSMGAVLLGLAEGGERVTVPMKALWHIGTAGPTGAGKSNIARLILPQLQTLGAKVAIIDPKWTPYDAESGEDWRPIARRLFLPPARKAGEIGDTIAYFHDELERRLELRNAGQKVGGPLFLYADEFTTITEDVKDAAEQVARLGRLGRGVGIFLLVAAHDLLVKSGAGDTRDQLRTGFYLGGDTRTGAVLLDLPQKVVSEQEGQLTTGLALLRSAATSPARLVRVPYASNAGVAALLGEQASEEASDEPGQASGERPFGFRAPHPGKPTGSLMEARSNQASSASVRAEAARALALFRQGLDIPQIVRELYGIEAGSGGRRYQEAAREVQALLREALMGGA